LRRLLRRGLEETAALWPPVRLAYRYVRRVARLLRNQAGRPGKVVRRGLRRLLRAMRLEASAADSLSGAVKHFVKVSVSYEPGLFHCYDVADLPRTNNDLEQLFGSHRYHERRSSGRKVASPGLVVRGSVRLVSGVLTRLGEVSAEGLAPQAVGEWQELRQDLERRRHTRVQGRRFRRNPRAYLRELEEKIPQSRLPS
jgi:hypothetical protein